MSSPVASVKVNTLMKIEIVILYGILRSNCFCSHFDNTIFINRFNIESINITIKQSTNTPNATQLYCALSINTSKAINHSPLIIGNCVNSCFHVQNLLLKFMFYFVCFVSCFLQCFRNNKNTNKNAIQQPRIAQNSTI